MDGDGRRRRGRPVGSGEKPIVLHFDPDQVCSEEQLRRMVDDGLARIFARFIVRMERDIQESKAEESSTITSMEIG